MPKGGKTWTNGSTKETVYADTAKNKTMKKSILLLIIIACVGCALAFTVFSNFRLIVLIISAVAATSALVMIIKNRKELK